MSTYKVLEFKQRHMASGQKYRISMFRYKNECLFFMTSWGQRFAHFLNA